MPKLNLQLQTAEIFNIYGIVMFVSLVAALTLLVLSDNRPPLPRRILQSIAAFLAVVSVACFIQI